MIDVFKILTGKYDGEASPSYFPVKILNTSIMSPLILLNFSGFPWIVLHWIVFSYLALHRLSSIVATLFIGITLALSIYPVIFPSDRSKATFMHYQLYSSIKSTKIDQAKKSFS